MTLLAVIVAMLTAFVVVYAAFRIVDWIGRAIVTRFFLLPDECRGCLRQHANCVCARRTI